MSQATKIVSTGSALPRKAWSNADLIAAKNLDSTPEWIEERTGITQRYLAEADETTTTLAAAAAAQALARAGVSAAEVGLIVVATATPTHTMPGVAAEVHGALGLPPTAAALDVNAACSGFIYALNVAHSLLANRAEGGAGAYALVIGAEVFSRVLDWSDRSTCVLFGDGAGAVLIHRTTAPHPTGLLGISLGANGAHATMLGTNGGVVSTQTAGTVHMQGREVYKHAVRQMGAVPAILTQNGFTQANLDWVVPHQANSRIITAAAQAMGVPMEKVILTVPQHANTSAASIPLALDAAAASGRLRSGHLVLLQAFGAGFTWADALIRW